MKFVVAFLFLAVTLAGAEFRDPPLPRIAEIGKNMVPVERIEILLPEPTGLLEFAGTELKDFLRTRTGKEIPLKIGGSALTPGALTFVLGDCALARRNGIDVDKLPQQGYAIKREGNVIFIAGLDSKDNFPAKKTWAQWYDRGTISGVYDFLERFAGIRFYFPGELGTVVPEEGPWSLPEKINIVERPDYISRQYSVANGAWYEKNDYNGVKGHHLNLLRLRMESFCIPQVHGLARYGYIERFGKSNPEYFALMPDGKRYKESYMTHTGQLCYNSGIKEVVFKDAKAFLTGRPAGETGARVWGGIGWDINAANGSFFNLMPQDWFYMCGCKECAKTAPVGRDYEKYYQPISDFMWGFTRDIAQRLKNEGVKGTITQMAYEPFHLPPTFELPDNILVQVGVKGPWNEFSGAAERQKKHDGLLRSWYEKLGKRTWLWTYAGKYGALNIPGLPPMTPRAIGNYFKDRGKWIFGGYMETETDEFIFYYLNYYIFGRVAWDNSVDVDKLLKEHHRLMFGAAAPEMERFYNQLEKVWLEEVAGNTIDTPLGPVTKAPTEYELWNVIYSPARLKAWGALFDAAENKVSGLALKRVKFIHREFLDRLEKEAKRFVAAQAAFGAWECTVPGTVWLRSLSSDENTVNTKVDLREDEKNFYFDFTCFEPEMAKLEKKARKADDPETYTDASVELLLNPSGDRKNYFQIVVNAAGSIFDTRCSIDAKGARTSDPKWNPGATASVQLDKDRWRVAVTVPKSALPGFKKEGFPVNFCRNRALDGVAVKEPYFHWMPLPGSSYHALDRFGVMCPASSKSVNLIKNGDFVSGRADWQPWLEKGVKAGQKLEFDEKCFISGGRSLRFRNIAGARINVYQALMLEPETSYRLSYYIRIDKVVPAKAHGSGAGALLVIDDVGTGTPKTKLTGTMKWHRLSFDFKTGKNGKVMVGLWNWFASGDVWFDEIRVEKR